MVVVGGSDIFGLVYKEGAAQETEREVLSALLPQAGTRNMTQGQ